MPPGEPVRPAGSPLPLRPLSSSRSRRRSPITALVTRREPSPIPYKGGVVPVRTMPDPGADSGSPRLPRGAALAAGTLLLVTALGTGAALEIIPGPTEALSVWMSSTEAPDFTLAAFDADIKGKNRVDVSFKVRNTDDATHRANVTVQLLGPDGDVLRDGDGDPLSATVDTGDVVGETQNGHDGTYSDTVSFQDDGVVERYESALVTVDQEH